MCSTSVLCHWALVIVNKRIYINAQDPSPKRATKLDCDATSLSWLTCDDVTVLFCIYCDVTALSGISKSNKFYFEPGFKLQLTQAISFCNQLAYSTYKSIT